MPLTPSFVKQHTGGDRDIKTLNCSQLRQAHEEIAVLPRELAQSGAFGAQNEHDATSQVNFVRALFRVGISAHGPDIRVFQHFERADEIGNSDNRSSLGSARGHFARGWIELRCPIFRDNYGQSSACIGRSQARAEIVRVLDAIQCQQQRIRLFDDRIQQIVFRPGRQRLDFREDALVHDVSSYLFEPTRPHPLYNKAVTTRQLFNFRHACIVTAICDAYDMNSLWVPNQRRPHRMQPVNPL
jgi:hypothetical protein